MDLVFDIITGNLMILNSGYSLDLYTCITMVIHILPLFQIDKLSTMALRFQSWQCYPHTINVMHRLIVKQSKLCGADKSLFVGGTIHPQYNCWSCYRHTRSWQEELHRKCRRNNIIKYVFYPNFN